MSGETQWSVLSKISYAQFLADNPTAQADDAKRVLYQITQAAEYDEPGAMATLIALKLSQNPQFADKTGGCKLAERAVQGSDESTRKFLSACTAN
jgi:hypothetical protein